MKVVSCFVILVGCLSSVVSAAPASSDGFIPYWSKFQTAAARGDTTTLATLTHFPVEASILADPSHSKHITRAQFSMLIKTELRCPAEDHHLTLLAAIDGTRFTGNNYHNQEAASVDRFSFKKFASDWKLVQIDYGETEEVDRHLKGRC